VCGGNGQTRYNCGGRLAGAARLRLTGETRGENCPVPRTDFVYVFAYVPRVRLVGACVAGPERGDGWQGRWPGTGIPLPPTRFRCFGGSSLLFRFAGLVPDLGW
jgi:hypothetical protein